MKLFVCFFFNTPSLHVTFGGVEYILGPGQEAENKPPDICPFLTGSPAEQCQTLPSGPPFSPQQSVLHSHCTAPRSSLRSDRGSQHLALTLQMPTSHPSAWVQLPAPAPESSFPLTHTLEGRSDVGNPVAFLACIRGKCRQKNRLTRHQSPPHAPGPLGSRVPWSAETRRKTVCL